MRYRNKLFIIIIIIITVAKVTEALLQFLINAW